MERWQALATLTALGFSCDDLPWINEYGGPESVFGSNKAELMAKLAVSKKSNRPSVDEAIAWTNAIRPFLEQGGMIAGLENERSLGRLQRVARAPLCAFVHGELSDLDKSPTVAIVGTRNPTRRGIERCAEITKYVVGLGCTVVSGGAMGIDTVAHREAVSARQRTIVVLGEPLSKKGELGNSRIRSLGPPEAITLVGVYGPWVQPAHYLFAARNQFVAALADAVIVVEGLAKSGTLHTAKYAHRLNVPVWVVPGDLDDPYAGAANTLLEAGAARALFHFESLKKSLKLGKGLEKKVKEHKHVAQQKQDTFNEKSELVDALKKLGGRATYDDLCAHLNVDVTRVHADISYLEIMGVVRKIGAELVLTGN